VGYDRRELGFWRALGRLRLQNFAQLESAAAFFVGGGGGLAAALFMTRTDRLGTAEDFQTLSGALVGIVFAGFALVVGLMSDRYALWLLKGEDGVKGFLGPFLLGVGIQITTLLFTVVYRAAGRVLPTPYEQIAFALVAVVFVYAALDVVALARTVLAHGVTRADVAQIEELERQVIERRRQEDVRGESS